MKARFTEAVERPERDRAAFLEEACPDDPDLRAGIDGLLAWHDDLDDFVGGTSPGSGGARGGRT